MGIFVGLLADGTSLDVPLIGRYGVKNLDDPDTPTSDLNAKFRDALATACDIWERHTGRQYASDISETRQIRKRTYSNVLALDDPATAVSMVEMFDELAAMWSVVDDSGWSVDKLRSGRGTYDSVVRAEGWSPGLYRLTGVWGEADVPDFVQFHALKLATHLWKLSDNISGFGSTILMADGQELPQDRVPWQVYDAMNRDRRSALAFSRRN